MVLVHQGTVEEYADDLLAYERWILSAYREQASEGNRKTADTSRREKRKAAAAAREKLRPLRKALDETEAEMNSVATRLAEIESTLADTGLYTETRKAELSQQLKLQGELRGQSEALDERWLELQTSLEELEASLPNH